MFMIKKNYITILIKPFKLATVFLSQIKKGYKHFLNIFYDKFNEFTWDPSTSEKCTFRAFQRIYFLPCKKRISQGLF
jgi:hypothetical protein